MTEAHEPGPDRLWGESWYFDFAAMDGSVGGFVRVGDYPRLGRRSFWAYLTTGPRAVGCTVERPLSGDRGAPWGTADPSLRFLVEPSAGGWHLAADGAEFALDLTWRAQTAGYAYERGKRLEQPGWAVGTVRVDGACLPVNGPGQRDQSWGIRDWGRLGWSWCAGWLSDGTRYQATLLDARGRIPPDGYLLAPGGPPEPVQDVAVEAHAMRINDTLLEFTDVGHVTVDLPASAGGPSRLVRAMTLVRAGGTLHGVGWRERNVPVRGSR
ncbi:hypothetical protein GCM10020358_66030 [Amorphoplanes nipponensis]|uniref:DUF7065 domain-containing protein n=1 Tax=Actinoplanes nipponensis TaxID=135950 RepID=A0A919JJI6_9ACTN|nr:hypothetical protein [Actinoplanes nipponensis]GIE51716.1 hypothetical protein Ani05nite_52500 [Actinoplanes nipponensis]